MRGETKTGARINSRIGRAIHDYGLIEDGDKILVAVSGGKDSLTLVTLLKEIQGWAPVGFQLIAAHILSDFQKDSEKHANSLAEMFKEMSLEHRFRKIKVADEKKKTTCFWCSWNRRKALFELADELGCNKVALGHHKDDIVETMLMNMLYNGEISAMNPRQELFDGKITVIRPLCYVEEKMIVEFAAEKNLPKHTCSCPFAEHSRRKFIKDFIQNAEKNTPKINIKTNVFKSISRIRSDYLDIKTGDDE
ncbi:MAG: tRNA lysidine(34) synthetase TilS [Candidatus Omnitrophica bacterium]|nr:tRNA lysidine(34) synthetase TilS [Candidatus Omnitrophota bacterium]